MDASKVRGGHVEGVSSLPSVERKLIQTVVADPRSGVAASKWNVFCFCFGAQRAFC